MPIVQFPSIVEKNLSYFAPVFQTKEQLKHFCEYVTRLIVGDKKTVAAINALFLKQQRSEFSMLASSFCCSC